MQRARYRFRRFVQTSARGGFEGRCVRDMRKVVEAMCAALPPEQAELVRMLRGVAHKAPFTAPEGMQARWAELCLVFNREAFGTSDHAQWSRARAPEWAQRAGQILAGEAPI